MGGSVIQSRRAKPAGADDVTRDEKSGLAFRAFCLLVASTLLHSGARLPILGALHVDVLIGLVAVVTGLAERKALGTPGTETEFERRITKILCVVLGYVVLTVPFVEWPGSVLRNGLENYLKAVLFYFLLVWSVHTTRQLKILLTVYVVCECWRIFEPLYLHLTEGYWGSAAYIGDGEFMERLSGAPKDTINPNGLAYLVVSTLPLIYYISRDRMFLVKLFCWGMIGMMIYALMLTGSRSGFLVLLVLVVLWIWQTRYKIVTLSVIALACIFALPLMSDLQKDRYLSIFSSHTQGAATAEGRITGLQEDFDVALRRPIFGHGLGTSLEANAHYRGVAQPSHNLYTEVLQELGFVGLVLVLNLLVSSVRAALYAVRTAREAMKEQLKENLKERRLDPFVPLAANSIVALLIVDITFSFASYGLSDSHWYLLSGLAVVTARIASSYARQSTAPGVSAAPDVSAVRARRRSRKRLRSLRS